MGFAKLSTCLMIATSIVIGLSSQRNSFSEPIQLENLFSLTCTLVIENVDVTNIEVTSEFLALSNASDIWVYRIDDWEIPQWHFTEHTENVNDLAFTSDGKKLASGSSDTSVLVWDVETGEVIIRLQDPAHSDIWSISFSLDNTILATGSSRYRNTGAIRLWDIIEGVEIATLQENVNNSDNVVLFSSAGVLASVETHSYKIVMRNVNPIQETARLVGHRHVITSLAFNKDGGVLASGSWDETIRLWDVESGENIAVLSDHNDQVNTVTFVPNQDILISGSGYAPNNRDHSLRFWNIATYQQILRLEYQNPIIGLAINSEATILAIAEYGQGVHICRISSDR